MANRFDAETTAAQFRNRAEINALKTERRRVLAIEAATEEFRRAKWRTVDGLTRRIAELSGGITDDMKGY